MTCFICRNVKSNTPFAMEQESMDVHHTYLDTVGRPVIILKKDNVVDNHIQDMEVCSMLLWHGAFFK